MRGMLQIIAAIYRMRYFSSFGIILILWTAGLCAAAQFAKMALVLPELQRLYPGAGAVSGLLITLISLVGAVLGLIAGLLVGQIGPRRVLISGLITASAISLSQFFSLPLVALLVTRVFEGASHLAIVVSAPTLIAHFSSDRQRASAMTLWGTFFGVSFTLTAWFGLPLVDTHGIHALFLAHAVVVAATTILVVLIVPNDTFRSDGESLKTNTYSIINLYKRHKQVWLSPYIAAPAAGWLFYTITFVALLAILPSLVPLDQRTFVAAAMPLASIASSMTIGVALLWRFTAIQVTNLGFASAIGIALFFFANPESALVSVLLFAALGLVQGASFAAIPELNMTLSNQALAYGALAQAGNLGNLCGTPLLILLLNFGGTKAMIFFVVSCYITAIGVHTIFARHRRLDRTVDCTAS